MTRPRWRQSVASGAVRILTPSKITRPVTLARSGNKPIVESATIDFPAPLSPVIATISPGATFREIPARILVPPIDMLKFSISRRLMLYPP